MFIVGKSFFSPRSSGSALKVGNTNNHYHSSLSWVELSWIVFNMVDSSHSSLNPLLQCAKAAKKANKITFVRLYHVFILPHLSYAFLSPPCTNKMGLYTQKFLFCVATSKIVEENSHFCIFCRRNFLQSREDQKHYCQNQALLQDFFAPLQLLELPFIVLEHNTYIHCIFLNCQTVSLSHLMQIIFILVDLWNLESKRWGGGYTANI